METAADLDDVHAISLNLTNGYGYGEVLIDTQIVVVVVVVGSR